MASKLATQMGGVKLNLWPEAENCVLSESFGNLPATSHNYDLLIVFAEVSYSLPCIRTTLLDDADMWHCFSQVNQPATSRCQNKWCKMTMHANAFPTCLEHLI